MYSAPNRSARRHLTRRASAAVLLAITVLAGCTKRRETKLPIETQPVVRRTIISEASATGSVEPINVVEVKSKSSGQISEMTVETGSQVKKGDLLVQLDTRDVKNQWEQTKADLDAAQAKLNVSTIQLKRNRSLVAERVITSQELETAQLDSTNSASAVIRAQTNLDLADQRLTDATVKAPSAGTILTKTVSLGQVIASATSSASGGTTLLTMADLSTVRVRANFNETDIANVHAGQEATLTVDAYPDRPFRGLVEKIEPQAIVNQSVTFFPVLVTLDNREGLLKPGMNGEVSVLVDTRENVLAVPNDAIRTTREAANTAKLLGLDPDSVVQSVAEQQRALMGGGNGARGGRGDSGLAKQESKGDVALTESAQQSDQGRQGGRRGGNLPQVTDAECNTVHAAFTKNPKAQEALQSMRGRGGQGGQGGGQVDFQRMRAVSDSIYKSLGIDANVARACNMRDRQQGGGTAGPAGQTGQPGGRGAAASTTPSGQSAQGRTGQTGSGRTRGNAGGGGDFSQGTPQRAGEFSSRGRPRTSLVYVMQGTGYAPRVIRSGLSDLDYTEVQAGLQEGERVVLLAAVQLQAQRDSANARLRSSQGLPGMTKGGNIGGGPGGPGGPGGGGPGGGGRRGGD